MGAAVGGSHRHGEPNNVGKIATAKVIQPLKPPTSPLRERTWWRNRRPLRIRAAGSRCHTRSTRGIACARVITDGLPPWRTPRINGTEVLGHRPAKRIARPAVLLCSRTHTDINTATPRPRVINRIFRKVSTTGQLRFDHVDSMRSPWGPRGRSTNWSGQDAYYQYYLPKGSTSPPSPKSGAARRRRQAGDLGSDHCATADARDRPGHE